MMTGGFLIFTIAGVKNALPLDVVIQVVPSVYITPLPQAPDTVMGTINYRGAIIPVFDLRRLFQFSPKPLHINQYFLICQTHLRMTALIADQVTGVASFADDDIQDPGIIVPDLTRLKGVVKTQNGLILIQNINAFLSFEDEQKTERLISECSHG